MWTTTATTTSPSTGLISFLPILVVVVFRICSGTDESAVTVAELCPDACFCNSISRIVYCSRRGLGSIPELEIPEDTVQLNLNGNHFRDGTVRQRNFSRYADLEHLYLSECSVDVIEVGAFQTLGNLRWLDISNNRLKVIAPETFRGLSLQHLFLNGNRKLVLLPESFSGLSTTGIYLHDCSLASVDPDVFRPLNSTMKYLWLNGNDMDRMDPDFQSVFTTLLHLRLGTNPLDCGCDAVWLKRFFDENAEIFRGSLAPSCLTPRKVRGRYFSDLSVVELRCRAPQFAAVEAHFEPEVTRLRCSASGLPLPVIYWTSPSGGTTKFTPPSEDDDDDAKKNEGVITIAHQNDRKYHVTESYLCSAFNDAGNVTATISVPWTMINTPSKNSTSVTPPVLTTTPKISPTMGTMGRGPQSSITKSGPQNSRVQILVTGVGGASAVGHQYEFPESTNTTDWETGRTGTEGAGDQRMFSLAELAWAVTCTHFTTMTVCFLVILVVYVKRTRNKKTRVRKEERCSYANMNFSGPSVALPGSRGPLPEFASLKAPSSASAMRTYYAGSTYLAEG